MKRTTCWMVGIVVRVGIGPRRTSRNAPWDEPFIFVFCGLHRGLRHGVHHGVFHDVGYSMVYTVEHVGICDDDMGFPMVCRKFRGCPMGCLTQYP